MAGTAAFIIRLFKYILSKEVLFLNYDFNREWLKKKFEEIQRRLLKAIEQLDDEQLNWRPDDTNHSISTLIEHIEGNIKERISKGILQLEIVRDRENELRQEFRSKSHLRKLVTEGFQLILKTLNQTSNEQLEKTQSVRNRERTNLDMLHQCAAHYSEHMGQVFYIAKQCLKENYRTTSI